jgi:hypothetical protein
MAVLDISEYRDMARDSRGHGVPTGVEPSQTLQQVSIGGTSTQSSALGGSTRFVRLHADVACRVQIGSNPTASATSMRLAAGATEFFGVIPGHKIAVVSTT